MKFSIAITLIILFEISGAFAGEESNLRSLEGKYPWQGAGSKSPRFFNIPSVIEEEMLYLFIIRDNKFRQIYTRIMGDTEYYGGYEDLSNKLRLKAILQIVPQSPGMNDFKIITHYYHINDADQDENEIVKITSELWRWNKTSQGYQLSE
jgi:hypothetical protein